MGLKGKREFKPSNFNSFCKEALGTKHKTNYKGYLIEFGNYFYMTVSLRTVYVVSET
jgi:hypothetical protein